MPYARPCTNLTACSTIMDDTKKYDTDIANAAAMESTSVRFLPNSSIYLPRNRRDTRPPMTYNPADNPASAEDAPKDSTA